MGFGFSNEEPKVPKFSPDRFSASDKDSYYELTKNLILAPLCTEQDKLSNFVALSPKVFEELSNSYKEPPVLPFDSSLRTWCRI